MKCYLKKIALHLFNSIIIVLLEFLVGLLLPKIFGIVEGLVDRGFRNLAFSLVLVLIHVIYVLIFGRYVFRLNLAVLSLSTWLVATLTLVFATDLTGRLIGLLIIPLAPLYAISTIILFLLTIFLPKNHEEKCFYL